MTTQTRRAFLLLVVLISVALLSTACGGSTAPDRPVIKLQVGSQTYEEQVYSYCWPESKDNLVCDLDAAAQVQPSRIIDIITDEEIRFVIEGDVEAPVKFTASLLDGPGGVQDLGAGTAAVYSPALTAGLYRVQVDAQFDDIEGQNAYVSYIFGLNIGGAAAVVPTETPTLVPASPTASATATIVIEPTATVTPTIQPTETVATPMIKPTLKPTLPPAGGETETKEAAPDVTEATGQGGTPTQEQASATAVQPSATPTIRPTSTPTVLPTNTPVPQPTNTPTAIPTDTPVPQPTDTPLGAVEITSTITPLATQVKPTLAPTLTPAQPTTQAGTGPAAVPEVPVLSLWFGGRTYEPVGYQYCQRTTSGERVCVEQPLPETTTRQVNLLRGAAAQIVVTGPRPDQVHVEYLTETGIPTGQPEVRPGDNITLLTITPEAGTYIMAIRISWAERDATYFLRITVAG